MQQTHWPWPINVKDIHRGPDHWEHEKQNRAAGTEHVHAFRAALEADGWTLEPTYSEPLEHAWRAGRDGFRISGLARPSTDGEHRTLGVPEVNGWCDRGIALRPIPLAYPGFEAIKALAHHCPECGRDGVETQRVAFANRACADCAPALREKLERPGWCD